MFPDTPSERFAFTFFLSKFWQNIWLSKVVVQLEIVLSNSNPLLAVILLPLRPASQTHKNPQRRKIIHCMCPVGPKDWLIDLKMCISGPFV